MSAPSIDQLTRKISVDEMKASIYQTLGLVGTNTTNWKPGAVVRTIILALAIILSAMSALAAEIAKSGFRLLASGGWLDLVGQNVYNTPRREATFATGDVVINNSGGGSYDEDPDTVIFTNSRTGKTYTNTEQLVVGPLEVGVTIQVRAVEAGAASSALPGEIDGFETPLSGLSVSNTLEIAALDADDDETYATAQGDALGALSPMGPRDAYRAAAFRAVRTSDGTNVGVNRVRMGPPTGTAFVDAYCATAAGGIPGDRDDPNTDLGAVNEALFQFAAPVGTTPRAWSAVPTAQDITYELWLENNQGFTEAQVIAAVGNALVAFFASLPIGGQIASGVQGYLYTEAITTLIGTVKINGIQIAKIHTELTSPAANVPLGIEEVATIGTVTAAVHFVAPPGG